MNKTAMEKKLSQKDEKNIKFQEDMLLSVLTAVKEEKTSRTLKQEEIRRRFLELRNDTRGLISQSGEQDTDLPMLYEQMHYHLSLASRKLPPIPSSHSPYFAHLAVKEKSKEKHYLLGYSAFISKHSPFAIIDWRNAPLAKLFFEYRVGEEYEIDLPGRIAEGKITQRNIVVIKEGRLLEVQNQNRYRKIDGTWQKDHQDLNHKLAGGQGKALRGRAFSSSLLSSYSPEIAALLDKKQYQILTENPFKPLLILGGAGSGKTTVALHRLASLHYQFQTIFHDKNSLIIVPEIGLVHLCRNLLTNLGLSKIPIYTFDQWIDSQKKKFLKRLPKKYCEDTPVEVIRCKRHPRIKKALEVFIEKKMREDASWIKKETSLADSREFFTDKECLSSMIDESNSIGPKDIEKCIHHASWQMESSSKEIFQGYDRERIRAIDGKDLDWGTPDEKRGTMDIEDIPILLELKYLKTLHGSRKQYNPTKFAHVILDETQEFSLIELAAIAKVIAEKQSVSIAGDSSQHTDRSNDFPGWRQMLQELNLKNTIHAELQVNYRCPMPISILADKIMKPLGINLPKSQKLGVPVRFDVFYEKALAFIQIIEALNELLMRESRSSIAVITREEEYAKDVFRSINTALPCRLVLDGHFSFKPGIDVCTVEQVKGLEFDYVLIPDANSDIYKSDTASRRMFYVAISRTIHQLWILSIGQPSILIKEHGKLNEN